MYIAGSVQRIIHMNKVVLGVHMMKDSTGIIFQTGILILLISVLKHGTQNQKIKWLITRFLISYRDTLFYFK
jgi:hypothetical protein